MAFNSSYNTSISSLIDLNNSNFTAKSDPLFEIPWLTLRLFICLVGIINSCLLMLVVWRDRSTSTGTRLLVLSLFFSACLLCGIFVPAASVINGLPTLFQSQNPRNLVCSMYTGAQFCLMTFGFTDVSLAINRLIAVCLPHEFTSWQSTRICCIMVGLSWSLAFLTVILPVFDVGGSYVLLPDMRCTMKASSRLGTATQFFIGVIPYSLVGLFSFVIFTTVYLKKRRLQKAPSVTMRYKYQMLHKHLFIAKAMALLLIVNLITSLPYIVTLAAAPAMFKRPVVGHIVTTLPLISYALNPVSIIYCYL